MSDVNSWAEWIAQTVVRMVSDRLCRPTSTYRIQIQHERMTFRDAAAIVSYLADLGVSHLYASPCQKVRSGSTHGYAIVDYGQLDPELGDANDYRAMVETLHDNSMGQILDTVSNHMSAAPGENLWWNDVLENGPASPHAAFFDIDWHPIKDGLQNRVLLPILGGQYGQVLESGELKLEYRDGAFFLRYCRSLLPIDPRTYRAVLMHGLDALKETTPADSEELRELESIITALEHLPERTVTEPAAVSERQREKEVIKRRLCTLVERAPDIAAHIRRNVLEFNGTPGEPHSYDNLDKLLDAQVYRLSHWKAADDEINYRRFFDINELAAVCMETPEVFAESHGLVFELLARGNVNGLRVDHIDGLYEPTEYLRRLQREYLAGAGQGRLWCSRPGCPGRQDACTTSNFRNSAALERNRAEIPLANDGDRLRRSCHAPAVRRGRENPRRGRELALAVDDGGHDGLRFPQFRERIVRRPRRTRRIGQHLRPLRQPAPRFPRGGVPIEAADLPHGDVERFAVARATGSIASPSGTAARAISP